MADNLGEWKKKASTEARIYRIFSTPPHSEPKRNKNERVRRKYESMALQLARELEITSREFEMSLVALEESYHWARRAVERHG